MGGGYPTATSQETEWLSLVQRRTQAPPPTKKYEEATKKTKACSAEKLLLESVRHCCSLLPFSSLLNNHKQEATTSSKQQEVLKVKVNFKDRRQEKVAKVPRPKSAIPHHTPSSLGLGNLYHLIPHPPEKDWLS